MEPFDLNNWKYFKKNTAKNPSIIDAVTIDSRYIPGKNTVFVALKGDRSDGHHFVLDAAKNGARFAIVNNQFSHPALPNHCQLIQVENTLKAFQSLATSYRKQFKIPIIAIGGTHGKTLLKDLLERIFSFSMSIASSPESFNSQIGVPLSLFSISKNSQLALIETGISKQGEIDPLLSMIQPTHAIISHIENKYPTTLRSLENTFNEIVKIADAVPSGGWVLYPNSLSKHPILNKQSSQMICWSYHRNNLPSVKSIKHPNHKSLTCHINFPDGNTYEYHANSMIKYVKNLLMMATKTAWLFNIPSKQAVEALSNYEIEEMRTEIWNVHGTTFINDSYFADPLSLIRALNLFDLVGKKQKKYFFFGGFRKNIESNDYIFQSLKEKAFDDLIPYGHNVSSNKPDHFHSLETALDSLQPTFGPSDVVLIKGKEKKPLKKILERTNHSMFSNYFLINLSNIKHNIEQIQSKIGLQNHLMPMVKANGYGTNAIILSKFFYQLGISILGVSYVEEAIELKKNGVQQDIFVIHADEPEIKKVVKWHLQVGVSLSSTINFIQNEAQSQSKITKLHLHVDTGMGRFGCRPEEALSLAKLINKSPNLILEGVFTHFACADDPKQDSFTKNQMNTFNSIVLQLKNNSLNPPMIHAQNTSAAIRFSLPECNLARIGIGLFGLIPKELKSHPITLKPALSLHSQIAGINHLKEGDTISYGRKYLVKKSKMIVAVIPLGYFDGIHRKYSAKGYVLIHGKKAKIVGAICMDFLMADITHIPRAAPGDTVLIFGEDEFGNHLSPHSFAKNGNTIPYELMTCLGPRIPRIFTI